MLPTICSQQWTVSQMLFRENEREYPKASVCRGNSFKRRIINETSLPLVRSAPVDNKRLKKLMSQI